MTLKGSIHPLIGKSLDIIKEKFERLCLKDQDILGTPDRWNKVQTSARVRCHCEQLIQDDYRHLELILNVSQKFVNVQDCEGSRYILNILGIQALGHSFDWPFDGHPEVTGYLSGDK